MNHLHLGNAPIKEAVIDLRVGSAKPKDILDSWSKLVIEGYSNVKPISHHSVGFKISDIGEPDFVANQPVLRGYRFENPDRGYVAQFQTNGFTFSKVGSYKDWMSFKQEAMTLWNIYKTGWSNISFKRVATRYINEIMIPLMENATIEYDEFVENGPKLPRQMGESLENYFSRLTIPIPDIDAHAIVILSLDAFRGNEAPIVLDIDVFKERTEELTENMVWEYLDRLREVKNKIFFGSITEKTIGLLR
jgi:uncharacterized protein (TIGR04255 family)